MIRKLLKLFAYTRAPKLVFTLLHPVVAAQLVKTPFDLRTAYAPRLTAVTTALIVGPLAYQLGKRAGERTLSVERPPALPSALALDEIRIEPVAAEGGLT